MEIQYQLKGAGWATGYVELNQQKAEFCVDYMSNALLRLTDLALQVLVGKQVSRIENLDTGETAYETVPCVCEWTGEPWGHKWVLSFVDDNTLQVEFLTFEDLYEQGSLVEDNELRGTIPVVEFVGAVVRMLGDVLKTYGFIGYKTNWIEHDFPIGGFLALRDFLKTRTVPQMALGRSAERGFEPGEAEVAEDEPCASANPPSTDSENIELDDTLDQYIEPCIYKTDFASELTDLSSI